MVVNDLVDSVIKAIDTEFNGIYPIYTKSVEQGLSEPCFFVFCKNPKIEVDLNYRYKRNNLFVVQYMDKNYSSRFDVMERLFNCLEVIECNGKLFRGDGFSAETIDDEILNITLDYGVFEYRLPDVENMMILEQEQVLK